MDDNSISRLLKNYLNARKSWEGYCYLNNIDLKHNNATIRKYVDGNKLLFHCRYLLLKDLHIELYKIIKDSRKTEDNIFKLLRENDSSEANDLIDNLNEFKSKLISITDIRDKFYAHLDKNYVEYLDSFKIEDYYKTFELIENAILTLGYETELKELLKDIPSRDEFEILINN
jgi:hypothetical protein